MEELEANFAANARKGDASGKDDKETSGKEHAASKEGGAVPGTPRKAEIVNLVDPKTANNTAIALSRFRRTAEDLANALLVGEEMPTEQISALLAILPSAEDAELVQVRDHAQIASRMALEIASPKALLTPRLPRARVQAYDGDKATLGKAEQFFLVIAKVPRYSARTRALQVRD